MVYDSADRRRIYRDPPKLSGVYTKCADPRSGIANAGNLSKWSDYSRASSYHGNNKPQREPATKNLKGTEPHPPHLKHR